MNHEQLLQTVQSLSHETEWVEFKENNKAPVMIGERISALANSAALLHKEQAYFIWGVKDDTQALVGTNFRPYAEKYGNEPLESWLAHNLSPCPDFRFSEHSAANGKRFILLGIPAATH